MDENTENIIGLLQPNISESQLPKICLKSLELKNFGLFDHVMIDFRSRSTGNIAEQLIGLIGPNGYGKTTILAAIQMLFCKFGEYDEQRYKSLFTKYIRNVKKINTIKVEDQDLMIKGTFHISGGNDYDVCVTRQNGVVSFHPQSVSDFLPYFCFCARFDQELDIFQLKRSQWNRFKNLFENITGYEIFEDTTLFDQSEDTRLNNLVRDYVLGFNAKKEGNIIGHKQCSAGEKKIIKTFSTILNKIVQPRIILIDNAVMHVESDRHLNVIQSISECFADSQIILTCHSEPVKRGFSDGNKIIDLRCLKLDDAEDFWKIRYLDELVEMKEKLNACNIDSFKYRKPYLMGYINNLMYGLMKKEKIDIDYVSKEFLLLSERASFIINENLKINHLPRIKKII
jgi:ABC-type lipoprotein export system ATPase subunit